MTYRDGYAYTNILSHIQSDLPIKNEYIYPWGNFDGVHYLSIAGDGYLTDGRFFPLYPMTIFGLSTLLGDNNAFSTTQFFAAFLIANVSFVLALLFLYRLIKMDYSEKTAKHSIIFLLLFPTSFFFGSIYGESLFLFLLVMAFYFANKKRWLIASFFGLLLSATRINGIFVFPALVYQVLVQGNLWRAWPIILIPLGLLSFGAYSFFKFGDFFNFIKSHGGQANGRSVESIILPFQTIYRYYKIVIEIRYTSFEWWLAIFEVFTFVFVFILLYLGYKQKIKGSYLLFAGLSFLLPSLSGTFSALPRYVLVLFPIFIVLGNSPKIFKISYSAVSIILLFTLLMFFSRGYFVA